MKRFLATILIIDISGCHSVALIGWMVLKVMSFQNYTRGAHTRTDRELLLNTQRLNGITNVGLTVDGAVFNDISGGG